MAERNMLVVEKMNLTVTRKKLGVGWMIIVAHFYLAS